MPGQQRRGGPRSTPGTGARSRANGLGRTPNEQASQPRSARLGGPRVAPSLAGSPRVGTARPTRAGAARPIARPAAARRAPATGAAKRALAPQPHRFTARATVLVLVLGALLLAYAYPVRIYLNQQAEIAALRAHQKDQQAHIADLQAESDRWNDPAYIKAQARSRLQMGEPGETIYIVVGGDTPSSSGSGAGATGDGGPWYDQLWASLTAADQPRPSK